MRQNDLMFASLETLEDYTPGASQVGTQPPGRPAVSDSERLFYSAQRTKCYMKVAGQSGTLLVVQKL